MLGSGFSDCALLADMARNASAVGTRSVAAVEVAALHYVLLALGLGLQYADAPRAVHPRVVRSRPLPVARPWVLVMRLSALAPT